ncbi:MAG: DUF4867 family protein [Lachnospiraceae bacterium]|nr:DUF4867 family protein [Lachnospiraceae bacterium]
MVVRSVTDAAFKKYGKVVEGIDCSDLLKVLSGKPMPADSVVYVASDKDLEATKGAKEFEKNFYGGLPIQIGYCNGNNKLLNAVEYHRCSEVNIALYDSILLIGDQRDIEDDFTYDTSKIEAFKVPAGVAVELYATTLHYAPCTGEGNGFRVIVILPRGTNADFTARPEGTPEDKLLMAENKWLIAHKDGGQDPKAFIGLKGVNVSI